jgi:CheY-like chemotaxis protein/signal transduction histidine kinase
MAKMIFPLHPPIPLPDTTSIPPSFFPTSSSSSPSAPHLLPSIPTLPPSQVLNRGYEEFLKEESSLVLVVIYLLVFNSAIIIRCFVSYSLVTSLYVLLTIPGYLYLYATFQHQYHSYLPSLPIRTIHIGNVVVILCAFITGFIVYSTSHANTCSGFACQSTPNGPILQPNFYALAISNTVFTPAVIKSHTSLATTLSLLIKLLLLLSSALHLQSSPGTFLTIIVITFFQGLLLLYYESYTKRMFLNQIQIEFQVRATIAVENEKRVTEMQGKELKSLIGNVAHDLKSPLQAFSFELDTLLSRFRGGGGGGSRDDGGEGNFSHGPVGTNTTAAATVPPAATAALAPHPSQSQGSRGRSSAGASHCPEGCVESVLLLKSISSFMVMLINRAIDYTKATSGIALKPSYETLHVTETMEWVVRCAERCNRQIPICILPTPRCICRYIISDRQWLLENLLCLVSNAQKFTSKGDITIRCLLITPTLPPDPHIHPSSAHASVGDAVSHSPVENESIHIAALSTHDIIPPVTLNTAAAATAPTAARGAEEGGGGTGSGKGSAGVVTIPFLCFEVEDSGIGINDDQKKELFRPFKQAQRRAGGTGLGLYSLAKRVESLGGSCGISNRHDGKQGARFWFTIPYRPDDLVESQQSSSFYSQSSNRVIPIDEKEFSSSASRSFSSSQHEGQGYGHDNYERRMTRSSFKDLEIAEMEFSPKTNDFSQHTLSHEESHPHPHLPPHHPPQEYHDPGQLSDWHPLDYHPLTPSHCSSSLSGGLNSSHHFSKSSLPHSTRPSSFPTTVTVSVPQGKRKILLVEDSTLIQKTTMRALAREGYLVDLATNGLECLEMIEKVAYDIILMDIQMPLMDGLEATARLREIEKQRERLLSEKKNCHAAAATNEVTISSRGCRSGSGGTARDIETGNLPPLHSPSSPLLLHRHHLIVIGLSANVDDETKEMALAAGMDEFIPKPLSMESLKLSLKKLHASFPSPRP